MKDGNVRFSSIAPSIKCRKEAELCGIEAKNGGKESVFCYLDEVNDEKVREKPHDF